MKQQAARNASKKSPLSETKTMIMTVWWCGAGGGGTGGSGGVI